VFINTTNKLDAISAVSCSFT